MVFEDLYNYKSGIYTHKTGVKLGGHAIKLIGWGKENNVEYWLGANSWGEDFGEQGYFKLNMNDASLDLAKYAYNCGKLTPGPGPGPEPVCKDDNI